MLECDLLNLNKEFKKTITLKEICLFLKALFSNQEKIQRVLSIKKHTKCSIFESIKLYNLPIDMQFMVFNYSFPQNCKYIFLQMIKDKMTENNFSDTFSYNLNRIERLELSIYYNKKFYK